MAAPYSPGTTGSPTSSPIAAKGGSESLRGSLRPASAEAPALVSKVSLRSLAQALPWLERAAERGDRDAQLMLGAIHEHVKGVYQDNARAVFWYRKAAEQGASLAQLRLGFHYDLGRGVRRMVPQPFTGTSARPKVVNAMPCSILPGSMTRDAVSRATS